MKKKTQTSPKSLEHDIQAWNLDTRMTITEKMRSRKRLVAARQSRSSGQPAVGRRMATSGKTVQMTCLGHPTVLGAASTGVSSGIMERGTLEGKKASKDREPSVGRLGGRWLGRRVVKEEGRGEREHRMCVSFTCRRLSIARLRVSKGLREGRGACSQG